MKVLQALQALEVFEVGTPAAQRRARALVDVAEAAVASSTTGVAVPEIVAHIRHEDVSAGTSVLIEDEVAVSRTTAQRLCCDAAVVPLLEDRHGEALSIGRRSRTIPPAIRRALNARDQGCRFPGCTHTRFLHGHDIQHWANDGDTSLSNLEIGRAHV